MPDLSWWPFCHGHRPCDCVPRPVLVTIELRDSAGGVKDVRDSEFLVRPCHHHGPHGEHHGRHERTEGDG
jgi:hypothetical protein